MKTPEIGVARQENRLTTKKKTPAKETRFKKKRQRGRGKRGVD